MNLFKKNNKYENKEFEFKIPLDMSLHDILLNTRKTIEDMIDMVNEWEDTNNIGKKVIKDMNAWVELLNTSHSIVETQALMLGMDKTSNEKVKEFNHVIKLGNKERKYCLMETQEQDNTIGVKVQIQW
jgi:hypothetical protein